jgi:nucleoid-associated protein YgaU
MHLVESATTATSKIAVKEIIKIVVDLAETTATARTPMVPLPAFRNPTGLIGPIDAQIAGAMGEMATTAIEMTSVAVNDSRHVTTATATGTGVNSVGATETTTGLTRDVTATIALMSVERAILIVPMIEMIGLHVHTKSGMMTTARPTNRIRTAFQTVKNLLTNVTLNSRVIMNG